MPILAIPSVSTEPFRRPGDLDADVRTVSMSTLQKRLGLEMRSVRGMNRKKDRIADIVDSKPNSAYSSVRDDLIRAGGAFSTVRPPHARDVRWLESKTFDPTTRFVIISQILLPRICSIIGRGLTMEEIGLLTGIDHMELKSLIRKSNIKDAVIMEADKVDRSEFVNIHLPFRRMIKVNGTDYEERIKEPMLAPKRLVNKVRRNGYMTEDGHLWRYDYVSLVSGPLPTVYTFRSIKEVSEENMEQAVGIEGIEDLSNDHAVRKAEQEIAISMANAVEPLIDSEQFPEYLVKMTDFFSETYANTVRYAWRYRALNDLETFNEIELLVRPLRLVADDIKREIPMNASSDEQTDAKCD